MFVSFRNNVELVEWNIDLSRVGELGDKISRLSEGIRCPRPCHEGDHCDQGLPDGVHGRCHVLHEGYASAPGVHVADRLGQSTPPAALLSARLERVLERAIHRRPLFLNWLPIRGRVGDSREMRGRVSCHVNSRSVPSYRSAHHRLFAEGMRWPKTSQGIEDL